MDYSRSEQPRSDLGMPSGCAERSNQGHKILWWARLRKQRRGLTVGQEVNKGSGTTHTHTDGRWPNSKRVVDAYPLRHWAQCQLTHRSLTQCGQPVQLAACPYLLTMYSLAMSRYVCAGVARAAVCSTGAPGVLAHLGTGRSCKIR
jgi:hypothetical protein